MASINPNSDTSLFTCLICGQEGLTELEMKTHVFIEHVECNVFCPFCDLSGVSADEMSLHINNVHSDDLLSPTEICEKLKEKAEEEISDQDIEKLRTNGKEVEMSSDKNVKEIIVSEKKFAMEEMSSGQQREKEEIGNGEKCMTEKFGIRGIKDEINKSIQKETKSGKVEEIEISSKLEKSEEQKEKETQDSNPGESLRGRLQLTLSSAVSRFVGEGTPGCFGGISRQTPRSNAAQVQVPDINDNFEPDINCNIPAEFACPFCEFITSSDNLIQSHVNTVHIDILSPERMDVSHGEAASADNAQGACGNDTGTDEYVCPLCDMVHKTLDALSKHVNISHSNVFSPEKVIGQANGLDNIMKTNGSSMNGCNGIVYSCPVCEMEFTDGYFLQSHVNGHFSADNTPVQELTDQLLAKEIEEGEREKLYQEEQEFQNLQAMYGMAGGTNYKRQYEQNLEKAVTRGDMTVVEYHQHRISMKKADTKGVDDGHSCTKDVILRLQEYYSVPRANISRVFLCSHCDHYSGSYGDKGWGCGYRNFQMLLSSLAHNPTYCKVLFNGTPLIPSIPKIQRLIEAAWQKGFDKQGCDQLGGQVFNTSKWIGATEIVATLSSLKIKCQLLDFHHPTGPQGTHTKLFEWVKEYFEKPAMFKPPLYLQHLGHSRTIVGVEEWKDKSLRLLLFDPSTPKKQMTLFHSIVNTNMLRTLRRPLNGLKAKQYQIVAVLGVLDDKEYKEAKVLKSDQIS
ncbi:hypothetical protein CHS0354_032260 [Potamilus streckersoni]|uniref:Zinc finger-containing ubiquitin peptidase 1 n=1 Tax=Potamilus streckersoni TaxID=2493646 RepID=A0AAE0VHU0_9BIVA|nr:hypothetical protein CHS0354_032260 [Potamilus streckersoni]